MSRGAEPRRASQSLKRKIGYEEDEEHDAGEKLSKMRLDWRVRQTTYALVVYNVIIWWTAVGVISNVVFYWIQSTVGSNKKIIKLEQVIHQYHVSSTSICTNNSTAYAVERFVFVYSWYINITWVQLQYIQTVLPYAVKLFVFVSKNVTSLGSTSTYTISLMGNHFEQESEPSPNGSHSQQTPAPMHRCARQRR